MILPVHARIRSGIRQALEAAFGLAPADQPAIVIEMPPNRALGDLGVPVAFELARRLKRAPRQIASDLAERLGPLDGVSRVVPAPNGYLNFFLDRGAFLRARLGVRPGSDQGQTRVRPGSDQGQSTGPGETGSSAEKVIVEHTAINPNKTAHIGHLRNAALGDTLVRALRFLGHPVEVQNYIDDTGVQVADVVVGLTTLEGLDLPHVRALADRPDTRFDYYCWDLYARVTEWYEADKARLETRAQALHALEEGGNPLADIGALVADRMVRSHLRTMARINVDYDLLTWEGDILRLHFWSTAFEQLKSRQAVFFQTEGRLKGCWVMPIEDAGSSDDAKSDADDEEDADQREKVIVRSNGTVTYVGKDIANQFWKFGLLDRDFHYRVYDQRNGHALWATTSHAGDERAHPSFGRASAVYNVIDSRQAYLQQLLKQALATMGFRREADRSTHYSYEMVALSHSTARALGYDAADSAGKPFVEVSGRKGLGVKADDLLDRLVETAQREVTSRNPELGSDDRRRIAEAIATAALRYFLIKFSRGKVIAFDIDEALSFEGETGPYIQYAVVRANNIFAKLSERDGLSETGVIEQLDALGRDALDKGAEADELWGLVLDAGRLDEVVEASVRSLELSVLAKYAFGLAQAFNAFYHRQQILREERQDARLWRAAGVAYLRRQLTHALDLMGCDVPVRM
jgi:arginyl-tRNA synthetase